MPTARAQLAVVSLGGKLYAIGGHHGVEDEPVATVGSTAYLSFFEKQRSPKKSPGNEGFC